MRKAIHSFIILILAIVIFLLLLPSLLSTDIGRKQLVAVINSLIPGEVEIRRLQLHWRHDQIMEGFHLKDPEGNSVLRIETFSTETPLLQILQNDTQIGMTRIHNLNANVVASPQEWINFNHAWGVGSQKSSSPAVFELHSFEVKLEMGGSRQLFTAWLEGEVQHGEQQGSVQMHVLWKDFYLQSWQQLKEQLKQYLLHGLQRDDKLELRLIDFPPRLLDALSNFHNPRLKGCFGAFFGEKLNLTLRTNREVEATYTCSVEAPQVEGIVEAAIENNHLLVHAPSPLHFQLTPEFVNSFTPDRTHLLKIAPVMLSIHSFSIPLAAIGSNDMSNKFLSCGFNINAELASTDLHLHPLGLVNVDHFDMRLDSESGDPFMHVKVVGHADYYKKPIDINFERRLNKPTSIRF